MKKLALLICISTGRMEPTSHITNGLQPLTRKDIHVLREQVAEEKRPNLIKNIVSLIYMNAVETIKRRNEDKSLFIIEKDNDYNFYMRNINTILKEVQSLFPDCSVKYLDGACFDYIVVDWS